MALGWQGLLEFMTGFRTSEVLHLRWDAKEVAPGIGEAGLIKVGFLHLHRCKGRGQSLLLRFTPALAQVSRRRSSSGENGASSLSTRGSFPAIATPASQSPKRIACRTRSRRISVKGSGLQGHQPWLASLLCDRSPFAENP